MTKSTLAPRNLNIVRTAIVLGIAALLAWSVTAGAEENIRAIDWQEMRFLELNTILPEYTGGGHPGGGTELVRPIFDNYLDARFWDNNVELILGGNDSARFQEVTRPMFENYQDARFWDDNVTLHPGDNGDVSFQRDNGAPPQSQISKGSYWKRQSRR